MGTTWNSLASAGSFLLLLGCVQVSPALDYSNFRMAPCPLPFGLPGTGLCAIADLDRDGILDSVIVSDAGLSRYGRWTLTISLSRDPAHPQISVHQSFLTPTLQLKDVDGDSDLDLILSKGSSSRTLFRNNGLGGFVPESHAAGPDSTLPAREPVVNEFPRPDTPSAGIPQTPALDPVLPCAGPLLLPPRHLIRDSVPTPRVRFSRSCPTRAP